MFEKFLQPSDRPDPFTGSPLELATSFMDGLTPFNIYRPLNERLRDLNARFMSNDKEITQDGTK